MNTARTYRLIARMAETDAGETWRGVALGGPAGPEPATLKILASRAVLPEVLGALSSRVSGTARLKHPSLLIPWELGTAAGRTVLAAGHVLGHDMEIVLQRLRSREVKLTVSRAVHLVAEAANAVSALHLAGLVHGSLGPSDLFVGFDGSIRVSCAGLRPALEQSQKTRQIATRGRKSYRAPELSRSVANDAYADVYALGAIVYELTTGKSLEEAGPRGTSTRSDTLTPPSRIDRRVPMKLDAVILKALETARTRRYKDSAELREALWGYLDEMGEIVTPADLASFAGSVLPNEVVQKDFDPEEPVSGTPPIPGTFGLEPIAAGSFPAAEPEATDGTEVPTGPTAVPLEPPTAERTVRVEAATFGPPSTDPAAPGMPTSAPDLSDAEAAPAPDSLAPPPGMLSEAPPAEESPPPGGDPPQRGDIISATVKMPAAPAHVEPAPGLAGGNGAIPRTDAEGYSPAFDVPAELGGPVAYPTPPPTELDPVLSGMEPANSGRSTEVQPPLLFRRRMWPWLLVAGIAPILVAVGFILGRQDPQPSPAELAALEAELGANDPAPEATARPDPIPAEAAGSEESDPAGLEAALPELALDPAPPDPTPVVAQKKNRVASRKASRRKKGRLTILASHRARVYIDGKDTGRFTPIKGYLLPAGRHVVTLIQPSTGMTQKRKVTIRSGGRSQLKVRFH